jgi:nitroreductase
MIDVSEAITGRRSIRAFKRENVSEEIIEKLIDAAQWAPSAGNIQPWEFVIVREVRIKRKLAETALDQTFIEDVPVVIVVCASEILSSQRYGDRGKELFCLQDTAAAIQNILLLAYSFGLGTCWVGAFNEEEVRETLKVPNGTKPVAIVPVGYPAEMPQPRRRKPIKEIVHHDTF